MIRVSKVKVLSGRQEFLKVERQTTFVDYIMFDTQKDGYQERAVQNFERMVRMECAQ